MRDPKDCKMCDRLYKEYPMDGLSQDELVKKYFPNVIKRQWWNADMLGSNPSELKTLV